MKSAALPVPWTRSPGWREFFDLLSDAVVVFDAAANVVVFANTAALRLLPCEAGMNAAQLEPSLGRDALAWLRRSAAMGESPGEAVNLVVGNGRTVQLGWRRLDDRHGALRLLPVTDTPEPLAWADAPPLSASAGTTPADRLSATALRETIALFWASPFPTLVQGDDFRLLDANPAFLDFTGYRREQLVGRDPKELHPSSEWPAMEARRSRLRSTSGRFQDPGPAEACLIDASGRDRRYRIARRRLIGEDGRPLYLSVLQDSTAEHVAREQADRSLRELDDWFDFSPVGMVLFDDRGLLLRTNQAFQALAGGSQQALPVLLDEAPEELRRLLLQDDPAALARLEPGADAAQGQAWVAAAGDGPHALRSIVRCHVTPGGQRRYMAVVEDRSAEEERDLAQMQIGTLIDTAGVGIATFQESFGWVRQRRGGVEQAPGRSAEPPAPAALQSINRELVTVDTLPEYEKLQQALRQARRAEVRYAIDHPELGRRWLLTRIEPATLASGQRTTSVVTLDVTEQHTSQQRSEQLLRELSTILESTTAGIAYLREAVLLRCNRRFETMLGLPAQGVVGMDVTALFAANPTTRHVAADILQALEEGSIYETEFELSAPVDAAREPRWYSLSVRRTGERSSGDAAAGGRDPKEGEPGARAATLQSEAIAVLTDVTRLKTQQMQLESLARDRELMFSLSGVGIAFIRNGRIQRANQALAQLAGCSVAELTTLSVANLFASEADFVARWELAERELRLYARWSGEHQLRMRDGRLLWVQVSKRLVVPGDLDGGFIASYVNVDARYRAERAVALQADRTRSILDSVLVGIVTVGPQGIEWMNRSARRMFGGDLADFINLPIATVATNDPAHPFRRTEYLTDLVEGQAETFECRVQARDGREFWIVGNVVSIARESTERQLTYALLDIERRREAEARMSEAQASLQRIIEAAPLAITVRDAHTLRVVQTNGVAAESAGCSREAMVGSAPEETMAPEAAAQHRRDMEQALAAADVTRREYALERHGQTRHWDARYLPLAARPGAPPDQLLLVATDVTEQRAAQEARFEAAISQRDMLVKEVHHRIKNNLQGVAGLLQQIAEKKPEVAGAISEVVGQVQAIAQVYGLQVGNGGHLNVADVIEAITLSVQRTFGRNIRCIIEGRDPRRWLLPEAESIPIALTLNELLTNAVKHSAATPQSEVRCAFASGEDDVRVRITNLGRLRAGFDLTRVPGGVSGLGLVRALLPRRSASLTLEQCEGEVVATVRLAPPGLARATQGDV